MATLLNTITYTTYDPGYRAHIEQQAEVVRPYKLTEHGARRVLRKMGYKVDFVHLVQAATLEVR